MQGVIVYFVFLWSFRWNDKHYAVVSYYNMTKTYISVQLSSFPRFSLYSVMYSFWFLSGTLPRPNFVRNYRQSRNCFCVGKCMFRYTHSISRFSQHTDFQALKIGAFYTTALWTNVSVDRSTTGICHLKRDLCLAIRISDSSPKNTGAAGSLGPGLWTRAVANIPLFNWNNCNKKLEVCLSIWRLVFIVSRAIFNTAVHFEQFICVFCVILLINRHCLRKTELTLFFVIK